MPRKTIQDLFAEERTIDPFRLAILGFSSIEQALDEGLAEAFDGKLPDELRRTPFNVRVALAHALNLIPEELRDPLGRLASLRNDFAHGKLHELTPSRAKDLYASLKTIIHDIDKRAPGLKSSEPLIILGSVLMTVQEGLVGALEDARDTRARQAEAMSEWWSRQWGPPLTDEKIDELLRYSEREEE